VPSAPGNALTDAAVIREVQERLYNLNYDIGILDGQLTAQTRTAIRAWQKNVNQEPTGELTDEELGQLRSARLPTTWGALAYAVRGASAVVWNRPSRQEAVSAALSDCRARAGRDNCKIVTAAETACGALGFYTATLRRTTYWGVYAIVRPTLGQAMDLALSECREQAKSPEACGIRLTFCADGSHKQ
jgi:peptidoglycan hydrolase-like protein with peptidoglycan-binding domain